MSIRAMGNIGVGYSNSMNAVGARLRDPEIMKDPGKLFKLNQDMFLATSGFEMSVQVMRQMNRMDQQVAELMRDA